jgi:hypothetical protein
MAKANLYEVPSPITSITNGVAAGTYEIGEAYQDPQYDNEGKQVKHGKLPKDLLDTLLERSQAVAVAEAAAPTPAAKEGK